MAKVTWTEPALVDLQEIIEYIANDSPVYAERVGIRVVQAPRRLVHFPLSGRIVPEFQDDTMVLTELSIGYKEIVAMSLPSYTQAMILSAI